MGSVMVTANKKISGKLNVEMFDDVPVLRRKWQAALRPGEKLPRYEDVMLGSLGKLADHIVLLKNRDDALEVSRTGRYIQKWLDDDRWDIPLNALPPDCATALGERRPPARSTITGPILPPRIACATAWSAPMTCSRCRHLRAGAVR